jgi:hypothetical protein
MKNDKITYIHPRKLLSHREATFPLEKKTRGSSRAKTSAGELLIVNTSSKEEFHHARALLPQLHVRKRRNPREKCPMCGSSVP